MKRMPVVVFLMTGAIVLGASGCVLAFTGSWATEQTELAQPAQGITRLAVASLSGATHVQGAPEAREIRVRVIRRARGDDAQDTSSCLQAMHVTADVKDGAYVLAWRWAVPKKRSWQGNVDFTITAPARLPTAVHTANGEIRLTAMTAGADLRTSNGAIDVQNLTGQLVLRSQNGRLKVTGLKGDLDAETRNGAIEAQAVASRIRALADNGRIVLDLVGSQAVSGEIAVKNGAITLRPGQALSAELAARTQNGAIRVAPALTALERRRDFVRAKAGAGEGRIELTTNNGAITIE